MRMLSCEKGVGAIEFALILPAFVALLFGIIEFGRYVYTAAALNSATRQAVRMAIVRSEQSGNPVQQAELIAYAKAKAVGLNTTSCTPTVSYSAGNVPGSTVTVALSCPFSFNVPGLNYTVTVSQRASMTIST